MITTTVHNRVTSWKLSPRQTTDYIQSAVNRTQISTAITAKVQTCHIQILYILHFFTHNIYTRNQQGTSLKPELNYWWPCQFNSGFKIYWSSFTTIEVNNLFLIVIFLFKTFTRLITDHAVTWDGFDKNPEIQLPVKPAGGSSRRSSSIHYILYILRSDYRGRDKELCF